MDSSKDWWAPFRVGLFTDKKHREGMGRAIWLYGYLHLYADRQTGRLARNCETIASEIGASQKTVQRWMRLLEKENYIQLRRLQYGFSIQIEKFRPIHKKKRTDKTVQSPEVRVDKTEIQSGQFGDSDQTTLGRTDKNVVLETNGEVEPKSTRADKNEGIKERFKESNKEREAASQDNFSAKLATKPPANPDVKVAIDHCYDEFERIHGIRPHLNGAACKTFQTLLNTKSIEQVMNLTTGYLSLADEKLQDKGYPIEWMPSHINRLMMAKKKPERGFVH
jgi:hypothetical protein